ncbi:hypothetical protein H2204_006731 [Knufia peltigerae]|uniref:protein-ribulosamine 3-kinase n=1 Tax=Knufia peltigerae TaxID=1002370 RepID=A0AA39CXL4_9EURO|nr:hypothetical protein H2204_006731 [Knufia peltigerae]
MPYIDPEFDAPQIPDRERYEGTQVDDNVLAALSNGTRVLWAATHGVSFWAITTKIDTENPDGRKQSYFLKVYTRAAAQAQSVGEYESTKALHAVIPDHVPRPVAQGALAKNPGRAFVMFEFKDMIEELPPAAELVAVIAKLHRESHTPNGKFGFSVPTSQALQLENTWCDTWEEFFSRAFRGTVKLEQEVQGYSEKLQRLADEIVTKVIPRLLRPMEIDGRRLKPTLVHGDLWHGNVAIDAMTEQVIMFDCGALFGHHEYDLGMFRAARYRTNRAHVRLYHQHAEISYPVEDVDDRNALYALRVDLETSVAWPANKRMRQLAMEEMKRLVDKYPDGFEGWHSTQAS